MVADIERKIKALDTRMTALSRLILKARKYASSDPEVSLTQARKSAEAICKLIFAREIGKPGKIGFDDLIRKLNERHLLDPKVIAPLSTIQDYGNFGSHPQLDTEEVDATYVLPCLQALATLSSWFWMEYLQEELPPELTGISTTGAPNALSDPIQPSLGLDTLLGKANKAEPEGLQVFLMQDPADPIVAEALDLYHNRIPMSEQFSPADCARWLSTDRSQPANRSGPVNFFFVAVTSARVVGMALFHYRFSQDPGFAFFAYLVAEKGIDRMGHPVALRLIHRISETLRSEPALADCKGFLIEVADPRATTDPDARREAISRIRLFEYFASANKFSLRALDFPYLQPHLSHVPTKDKEHRLLLMVAQRPSEVRGSLTKKQIKELLQFVYLWVYPTEYSEVETENVAYTKYLKALFLREIASLPSKIPLLDSKSMFRDSEESRTG